MEDIETLNKMMKEAAEDSGESGEEQFTAEQMAAAQEKLKLLMDSYRPQHGFSIHYSMYIVAFIAIFGIFGFFAYKLVQSLQNKEKKREEKRKLKEMKKKK